MRFIWVARLVTLAAGQSPIFDIPVENPTDATLMDIDITPDACGKGMFSKVHDWGIVPIHAAVLPDGRVATFGTTWKPWREDQSRKFVLWDYSKGIIPEAITEIKDAEGVDSFCAGAAILSDGNVLLGGGSSVGTVFSSFEASILDWKNNEAIRIDDLLDQRWYGTFTTIPDGRVVVTGGARKNAFSSFSKPPDFQRHLISTSPEIYEDGKWRLLDGADSWDAFGGEYNEWWFPRCFVSPHGSLFGISTNKMWQMSWDGNGTIKILGDFKQVPNENDTPNNGPTSTACMYDKGKILQMGGNGFYNQDEHALPSSNKATIIDINDVDDKGNILVKLTETSQMNHPRQWADSTILPDGNVLVTGGSAFGNYAFSNNEIRAAETWNPKTEQWTLGAEAGVYRGYHSVALLMPNGAVLTGGGGFPGPITHFNIEIYYPTYLFEKVGSICTLASRPKIVSMSAKYLSYGATLQMEIEPPNDVSEVAILSLPVVTHSFDSNQRRISLEATSTDVGVDVTMPNSPNLVLPGYHYIFVTNSAGVPSTAVIIGLSQNPPPCEIGFRQNGVICIPVDRSGTSSTTSTTSTTTTSTTTTSTTTSEAPSCKLTCPSNSFLRPWVNGCPTDIKKHCRCESGFKWHLDENVCISTCVTCPSNSFVRPWVNGCPTDIRKHCRCESGFNWHLDENVCISACVTCPSNSFVRPWVNGCPTDIKKHCRCESGLEWHLDENVCIPCPPCPSNSFLRPWVDGCQTDIKKHCRCESGFKWHLVEDICI